MSNSSFGQSKSSVEQNADFFNEFEALGIQERLELYQLMNLSVTRELQGVQSLLDVGNGGFFNYSTEAIPEVVACDLMLKDERPAPNIQFKPGSILDLPFESERFDCVLVQSVLHHVTGDSVAKNHHNMERSLSECVRVLKPGGKLVVIESTVPAWFYYLVEFPMYTLLRGVWRYKHPLTFQFTRHRIVQAFQKLPMALVEQVIIPRGNWVMQFGFVVPTYLTPIQAVKFVAVRS